MVSRKVPVACSMLLSVAVPIVVLQWNIPGVARTLINRLGMPGEPVGVNQDIAVKLNSAYPSDSSDQPKQIQLTGGAALVETGVHAGDSVLALSAVRSGVPSLLLLEWGRWEPRGMVQETRASPEYGRAIAGYKNTLVVGDPGFEARRGRVTVLVGPRWDPAARILGSDESGEFGASLILDVDLNGDHCPDLIVGAPHGAGEGKAAGAIEAFDGVTWKSLWRFTGSHAGEHLGTGFCSVADRNEDGIAEIAVGSPGGCVKGQAWVPLAIKVECESLRAAKRGGGVTVLCGRTGAVLNKRYSSEIGDLFGASMTACDDQNADNVEDLVVGVPGRRLKQTQKLPDGTVRERDFWGDFEVCDGRELVELRRFSGDGVEESAMARRRLPHGAPTLLGSRVASLVDRNKKRLPLLVFSYPEGFMGGCECGVVEFWPINGRAPRGFHGWHAEFPIFRYGAFVSTRMGPAGEIVLIVCSDCEHEGGGVQVTILNPRHVPEVGLVLDYRDREVVFEHYGSSLDRMAWSR